MPLACESGRSAFGCLRRLRGLLPGVLDSVDLVLQPEAHEGADIWNHRSRSDEGAAVIEGHPEMLISSWTSLSWPPAFWSPCRKCLKTP